jgi:hypothetical protein
MDIGKYIGENIMLWIIIGITILVVFMPLFRRIRNLKLLKTVTSLTRGTKTERDLVLKLLKYGIPAQTIFHDLCIKKSNGKHAQIDVVVATKEGIIVFEVKDYSGWIFGNGSYSHWTKVLAYGKRKYRFYNPIKQNKSHIKSLRKQLVQFQNIPFYSIVVFYGDCELKEINYVPEGTFLVKPARVFEVLKLIRENNEAAPYINKHEVVSMLEQAVINGENIDTQEKHVEDIHDMLGKHRIFD